MYSPAPGSIAERADVYLTKLLDAYRLLPLHNNFVFPFGVTRFQTLPRKRPLQKVNQHEPVDGYGRGDEIMGDSVVRKSGLFVQ